MWYRHTCIKIKIKKKAMIGNMPRSPVIGDWSDVTWCLVGRSTDTDKPGNGSVGPIEGGLSRLHTCDTETHNKESHSVGGTGKKLKSLGGPPLTCRVVCMGRNRGIPRLGARANPFFSWYSTHEIRCPYDFWLTFTLLPYSSTSSQFSEFFKL